MLPCLQALLCSLLLLFSAKELGQPGQDGVPRSESRTPSAKALLGLLASSAVLLLSCLDYLQAAPEAVYGLVCGAISPLPVLLLLLLPDKVPPIARALACALLVLLWLATVGACTFSRPFIQTGNGYFSCWLGLLCALKLALEADYSCMHRGVGGERAAGSGVL